MSTRTAELIMALLLGAFSIYLMWKSTELPIGWQSNGGPAGGFWPFWLSTVMLLSCGGILWNWFRRATHVSQSTEPFWSPGTFSHVGAVAAALIITVFLFEGTGVSGFPGIGVYASLPLFFLFYLKFYGNHSWLTTIAAMIIVPVATFLFFEVLLSITLPKGLTDPYFDPIYARVYSCPGNESWGGFLSCLINPDG